MKENHKKEIDTTCICIDGSICGPNEEELDIDAFQDEFIDWIESKGLYFGGNFKYMEFYEEEKKKSMSSKSSSGGIGFVGLLTIVFITLKLLGKITWNWWWVLSPIWIVSIIVVIAFAVLYWLYI